MVGRHYKLYFLGIFICTCNLCDFFKVNVFMRLYPHIVLKLFVYFIDCIIFCAIFICYYQIVFYYVLELCIADSLYLMLYSKSRKEHRNSAAYTKDCHQHSLLIPKDIPSCHLFCKGHFIPYKSYPFKEYL